MSADYATREQPAPTDSDAPAVTDLIIADLLARDQVGVERYGKRLRGHNGRDALVDAYQEYLDGQKYLRQVLYESGPEYQLLHEVGLVLLHMIRQALHERDGR
jgi:hypothetical protein